MSTAPARQRSLNASAFTWAVEKLCGEPPPADLVRGWFDDDEDGRLGAWAKDRLPEGIDAVDLLCCCESVSEAATEGAEIG